MSTCVGCSHTVDDQGNLELNHACSMNGLLTCVDSILNAEDGQTEGLGYTQSWPKRFSTLLIPRGSGFQGDDETFLGSPANYFGNDFSGASRDSGTHSAAIPCPTATPSFNDDTNNVELDGGTAGSPHRNGLLLCNDFDIPVMVKVSAHAWKLDIDAPINAVGGARWIGDVRIDIEDCATGVVVESLDWQRADELAIIGAQNSDYDSDPRDIETAAVNFGNQLHTALRGLADCVRGTVADEIEAAGGDGAAIRACVDAITPNIDDLPNRVDDLRFRISTADNPVPGNGPYRRREVRTGGAWAQTVLLQPGEQIRTQTRARFAHWDALQNDPVVGPLQTYNFCDASGRARPGQITYDVMPVAGGRQCDDSRFLGPFESAQGNENGDFAHDPDIALGLKGN